MHASEGNIFSFSLKEVFKEAFKSFYVIFWLRLQKMYQVSVEQVIRDMCMG